MSVGPRARSPRERGLRWAVVFVVLLAALVVPRVVAAWVATGPGWAALVVSGLVLGVFVGLPAAYAVRGLLRGDGDDR